MHKEHTDVPTKIPLADDKNILTSKNDEKVTTKVEHPYVGKNEFQRLQNDRVDLARQLQKTAKENSSLQVITRHLPKDKTMLEEIQLFLRMGKERLQNEFRLENTDVRFQGENL